MNKLFLLAFFTFGVISAIAQQPPPRPINIFVNPTQGLVFGSVFRGANGGSVIIYPDGSRSVTGDIQQAHSGASFSPAIFEIEANQGTIITIVNGPDVILNGTNGGTAILKIGESNLGSPFITSLTPPLHTILRVGGTLLIGSPLVTPTGNYSGTFQLTFIQQ
jgi:hypothetical protein